jgi:hypothetical protein
MGFIMKVANYNFQQDLSKVILWQYDDAEKFKSIVANEQAFMDNAVTKFWDDFNTNVFNLNTCNTFGLELWGKLLNIARPTYNDGGTIREYNDDKYRLLLRARIYVLTFDGSAKALNHFMKMILPEYPVMIQDNYDMTVDISFAVEPTADIKAVLRDDTFLPRPSGVEYILHWQIDYSKTFAFEGQTYNSEQMPAFTDADEDNYDPAVDGGGTFYK